jgi:hypothetical protein
MTQNGTISDNGDRTKLTTVSIDLDLDNPIHRTLAEIIKVVDDDREGYGSATNRANSLSGLSSRLNLLAVSWLDSLLKQRGG